MDIPPEVLEQLAGQGQPRKTPPIMQNLPYVTGPGHVPPTMQNMPYRHSPGDPLPTMQNLPYHGEIDDTVRALSPKAHQQLAGDVVPLPIQWGPQAGRPTVDEWLEGQRRGLPGIVPKAIGGGQGLADFYERVRKAPMGPRGY